MEHKHIGYDLLFLMKDLVGFLQLLFVTGGFFQRYETPLLNETIAFICFIVWPTKEISLNHRAVFRLGALSYFH